MSRFRPVRVLSLLLVVALLGAAFTSTADAKLSKAQKHAISKKLLRAVKHNPRVISKRWFLKKASLVSFSLPSTIRLTPAKDQNGNFISNDTTNNVARLDLGPSLGVRTIGLTGVLHANINFNDAFDGGSLGDVKISLPADTSALSTTAVPLLTNTNADNGAATIAPENELVNFVISNAAQGSTLAITNGMGATIAASFTSALATSGGVPNAFDVAFKTSAQGALSAPSGYSVTVGPNGVYEYSTPYAAPPGDPLAPACPLPSPNYSCTAVSLLFAGKDSGGNDLNGFPWTSNLTSAAPDWHLDAANTINAAHIFNAGTCAVVFTCIGRSVRGDKGTTDSDGMGGCGKFEGNGTASTGNGYTGFLGAANPGARDTDFPQNLLNSSIDNTKFSMNQLGTGPMDGLSPSTAGPGSVVLRTAPLHLSIAAPGTVDKPGDNTDNPGGELTANYTSGNTTLTVEDGSAFHANNPITVSDGFNQSLGTVQSVSGNVLTLTGALSPAHSYTANQTFVQITSSGVVKTLIGPSGGRANLFGAPVNGLSNGNSVDVTVNLGTDINAVARQVDGAFPEPAGPNDTNEKTGNISAYFNCRQAWTGNVRNYLNGIKLVGALRISPALTADGKVRIAKVALRTPSPVPAQLAACLQPYELYMHDNPALLDPNFGLNGPAPQLLPVPAPNAFNPLAVLAGSAYPDAANPTSTPETFLSNSAPPTDKPCNSTLGPLDRDPFNVSSKPGGTGLSNILSTGAAVGVSGNISTKIKAEVLIGTY